jgi:hypothetical protein
MRSPAASYSLKSSMVVCAVAGALAGPAAAAPVAVQAAAASGEMVLRRDGTAATLRLPDGGEVALTLPPRAEIAAIAGPAHGWLAVGTTPELDGASRLVVYTGDGARARRLPSVPVTAGRLQTQPVALASEQGPAAVAWLEGDDYQGLAVRAAVWEGNRWGAVTEVARGGRGSQLALAGAVLDDGSSVLVWAAFDGADDEILWSHGKDGEWSAPRRLAGDNAVPDITPAIVPVRGGALVAWSRYDGETYRVVTARLSAGRWSSPEVTGPAGSVYPSFAAAAGGGSYLLYRLAEPSGWEVVEVDPTGARGRHSAVPATGRERPVVLAGENGNVRLRFAAAGAEANVPWFPRRR